MGTVTLTLGVEPMCYHSPMHTVSYHRHRFPAEVIQHAVWLYFRFPLSFRDVEDLLAQRGIDVSYETVRRWSVKFGVAYARKLRRSHPRADTRWQGVRLDQWQEHVYKRDVASIPLMLRLLRQRRCQKVFDGRGARRDGTREARNPRRQP